MSNSHQRPVVGKVTTDDNTIPKLTLGRARAGNGQPRREYDDEQLREKVLDMIARGQSLRRCAEGLGFRLSDLMQLFADKDGGNQLETRLALARASHLTDQLHNIDDIIYNMDVSPQRARMKVDIIKWEMSKVISKIYGDKITTDVNVTLDVSGAISAANERVNQMIGGKQVIEDAVEVTNPGLGAGLSITEFLKAGAKPMREFYDDDPSDFVPRSFQKELRAEETAEKANLKDFLK